MKKSLRKQLTVTFIGAIVFVVALGAIANTLLLNRFYKNKKVHTLLSAYDQLNKCSKNNSFDDEEEELKEICSTSNLTMLVIDDSGDQIFTSATDAGKLKSQLFEHVLPDKTSSLDDMEIPEIGDGSINMPEPDDETAGADARNDDTQELQSTDDYEIDLVKDNFSDSQYIEIWGKLDDGSTFIIRTPMASIQESVSITNQFLLYVLVTVVVFGTILVWFLARHISEPIKELTILSSKMAKLDFNAKYTAGGENEIGVLGENFNIMSDKLKETISELRIANDKLKEDIKKQERINKIQSEFVSNVSHELKTPIALIQGYAEGLSDKDICCDESSREYYSGVIVDEANKMNKLVQNLLTLESMENDENKELQEFDFAQMVKGVIEGEKKLHEEITFEYEGLDSKVINSDCYKLEQVVINYINNAINHSDDGMVKVSVYEKGGKTILGVWNKCEGIPEEDSNRIWDKFFKVDRAHTREYGGSGIGLSIVKAIMINLGGDYGFVNQDGGVMFYITL